MSLGRLARLVLVLGLAPLGGGCDEKETVCAAACIPNRFYFTGTFYPDPVPTAAVELELCHQGSCLSGSTEEPLALGVSVRGSGEVGFTLELHPDGSVQVQGGAMLGPLANGDSYAITIRDSDTGSVLVEHRDAIDPSRAPYCGTPCPRAALCFAQAPGSSQTVACTP